jgi:Superinfection immunity protein
MESLGIMLVLSLYLLPTIAAMRRRHPSSGGIAVINIAFGWTLVGWVTALAWALSGTRGERPVRPVRDPDEPSFLDFIKYGARALKRGRGAA